jgi:hypothetical protein
MTPESWPSDDPERCVRDYAAELQSWWLCRMAYNELKKDFRVRLTHELGRQPTDDEVAKAVGNDALVCELRPTLRTEGGSERGWFFKSGRELEHLYCSAYERLDQLTPELAIVAEARGVDSTMLHRFAAEPTVENHIAAEAAVRRINARLVAERSGRKPLTAAARRPAKGWCKVAEDKSGPELVEALISEVKRIVAAHCNPDNPSGFLTTAQKQHACRRLFDLDAEVNAWLRPRIGQVPADDLRVALSQRLNSLLDYADAETHHDLDRPQRRKEARLEHLRYEFETTDLPLIYDALRDTVSGGKSTVNAGRDKKWRQRPDSGGKVKAEARRQLVYSYLDDECGGRWDGTLRELQAALEKRSNLSVSTSTLSRDLRGSKYRTPKGKPPRTLPLKGEREAVVDSGPADFSDYDAWTMPDDDTDG